MLSHEVVHSCAGAVLRRLCGGHGRCERELRRGGPRGSFRRRFRGQAAGPSPRGANDYG
ncbi:hypothetical protein RGE_10560 [Rubrivivax gelatinosus IL144]|uniref:Uncharacterized protein n=1 Tax=Rubrivivax gelatinosus (strain NBRC 100245 / IL144) TaxID=983917 RepID=I0HN10_RUBGI|nr:hypothetical protein RGE_10560 [Rubrivivax gelatinosus IL144]